MSLRFDQVHGALNSRIQRFSRQDQGDGDNQKQPFDGGYLEVAGKADCSESGNQMDSKIPLSPPEHTKPPTGMPKTLRAAFDPSSELIRPFSIVFFDGFFAQTGLRNSAENTFLACRLEKPPELLSPPAW